MTIEVIKTKHNSVIVTGFFSKREILQYKETTFQKGLGHHYASLVQTEISIHTDRGWFSKFHSRKGRLYYFNSNDEVNFDCTDIPEEYKELKCKILLSSGWEGSMLLSNLWELEPDRTYGSNIKEVQMYHKLWDLLEP